MDAGIVVRLKSGGPDMTVSSRDTNGNYVCQWFDGIQLREAAFPEANLVRAHEEPNSLQPPATA